MDSNSHDDQGPDETSPAGSLDVIETGAVARVRPLIAPIVADLGLDIYDLEHRGGVLRLTLDTPLGAPDRVTLDTIALASRLISKELDAADPIASRYTLEVTSPGVERPLRTADHFRRAVGQRVAVRLSDVGATDRRVTGVVAEVDDSAVTLDVDANAGGGSADGEQRRIEYGQIDRARTIFEWPAQPKAGGKHGGAKRATGPKRPDSDRAVRASDQTRHVEQAAEPGNAIEGEQS